MAEYIKREAAIKRFNFAVLDCLGMEPTIRAGDIIKALESIPAADVREVKRGKWKLATYSGKFGSAKGKWYDQFLDGAFWYCGNCKERAAKKTNFCPNCGARMVNDDV